MIQIINQIFELQQKTNRLDDSTSFDRNYNRLFSIFEEEGYVMKDPTNEPYQETRTDCEASIAGALNSKMKITKTMKPIIYQKVNGSMQLVQKAVVIVS